MKGIKRMLLGIAIILAVIVFRLFFPNVSIHIGFIAVIGMIIVIDGYLTNAKD